MSKLFPATIFLIPAWFLVSFYAAQLLIIVIIVLLNILGVPLQSINQAVLNSVLTAILYLIILAIVIGGPWLVRYKRSSVNDLGLSRLPTWSDILLTPAALVTYFILSSLLMVAANYLLPWFDPNQAQETGFGKLAQSYELILAFVTLVIIAPIAEEALFRGYLYGKLRKRTTIGIAIIVVSLLFGFVHGAWNLGIDTFALSVVACILYEITGSIWASVLLHMVKNGIAVYFIFIAPALLAT